MIDESGRATVLAVDDDAGNRMLLEQLLRRAGHDVLTAADGSEALAMASRADAVVLDVGLPDITGLEVCRRLRDDPAFTMLPVILVTGRSEVSDLVEGLDAGADDFLAKPYRAPELLARLRSALRLRRAIAEMEAAHGVVAALANAVEAKDVTTEHHCQRLATLAHEIAVERALPIVEIKAVVFGALLHDVGKIGIPEAILTKPGPLTADEWVEMQRHPLIGEQICRPLTSSRLFAPIVRHHHERWDGAGYPDRLAAEAIPLGARIVALVDAFDAMVHDRPYRSGMPLEQAIAELERNAGRQFDPDLVPGFVARMTAGAPAGDDVASVAASLALAS